MATLAGVGKSTHRKSRLAGNSAAEQALEPLGGRSPSIVVVFATAGFDQAEVIRGVRDVAGQCSLAGCSAEGVITQAGSDEGSHAVAVMAVASDRAKFSTFAATQLSTEPRRRGEELAQAIAKRAPEGGKLLLLFPDGVTANCTELLAGLRAGLSFPASIVGGTAGDLLAFQRTWQYCDDAVFSDGASAVLIGGDVSAEIGVSHGCDLIGVEQTITRADRGMVFEIDGKPAWAFFRDFLGDDVHDFDAVAVAHICLAEMLPAGPSAEYGDHVIRVPARLDRDTGALFFAGGLREGTKVQLAMRRPERVTERAVATAKRVASRRPGETPALVLHFDCAGRGRLLFGDRTTEAAVDPIQQVFGKSTPWLGLHTYGEIAPVGGEPCFHNYTVALCALFDGVARKERA